jgi:hypothetical protein
MFRVTGCNGLSYRLRRVARFRGSFGATRARITFKRPKKGYYLGRFAFGGTHFLRASSDPAPMFLSASRRSFGYARSFPRCTG